MYRLILCAVVICVVCNAQNPPSNEHATESHPISHQNVDILSDTRGVDFGPYLGGVLEKVRLNWYSLIPEVARPPRMQKGKVSIEFSIMKDGSVHAMRLVSPSGDISMDRAAWGGITGSNPFSPLPAEFDGKFLALRFHFYYNPDYGLLQKVHVKISPASTELVPGSSQQFSVKLKDKKSTVTWHVSGDGCAGSACGTVADGLYTAPLKVSTVTHISVVAEVTDQKGRTGKNTATVTILQYAPTN